MRKLSLGLKLAVGLGTPLLVLVVVGITSFYCIRQLSAVSFAIQQKAESSSIMRDAEVKINNRKVDIRSFLLSGDEKHMKDYEGQSRAFEEQCSALEKRLVTEKGKQMLAHLREAAEAYDRGAQRVAELQRAGKKSEAASLLLGAEMTATRADMEKTANDFVENGERLNAAARKEQVPPNPGRQPCLSSLCLGDRQRALEWRPTSREISPDEWGRWWL